MAQKINFSGSDQIQTPQYPDVHPPSQETSEEVSQVKEDLMKSIETFLEEFHCIPLEEKPLILLQAWFKFFAIKHDQPENSNELFQKLLEDLKNLAEYKESLKNSSKEIAISNSNEEKEGPPQDSDFHQLIEEFAPILSTKEPEYSSSMGYEHLSITPETESNEVTESNAENLLPIPNECEVTLEDKKDCDVPVSTIDVCDNHSDTFSDSKINDDISVYDDDFEDIEYVDASLSDPEIVNVEEENVVPQEEEEVDLEDISQIQDVVLHEKILSINRLIANIESLNDNSTPDRVLNSFESDNSLSDNFSSEFETFYDHTEETRSGNTTHADNSLPEYDLFFFEIEPDQERVINLVKNYISDDSSNDPLLEEANLFLASDNSIPPGIENFADDPEGDIRFLEELLINDSILSHESSDSNFEDNPSIPRPPPEPPDAETDTGEEISVVMNDKDKFDEDYYFFMFYKDFTPSD
nr:hypothetical protein [Tanacetum cinerariifolium]